MQLNGQEQDCKKKTQTYTTRSKHTKIAKLQTFGFMYKQIFVFVALHFMANLSIHMLKFMTRTKYAPTNRHFMQTHTYKLL